jgi:hypothetical protein
MAPKPRRDGRPSLADLKPKPRNDAYTILLTISLLATIGASTFLYYDLKNFPTLKPTAADAAAAPKAPADPTAAGGQQPQQQPPAGP